MLFSREWWKATAMRVARTAAHTLIAGIGMNYVGWFHDWRQILALIVSMSMLSFCNSILAPPPEGK